MAHRNSLPKTTATERTKRRYRDRYNIMTAQDKKHKNWLQTLKEKIFNDRIEVEALKHG